MDLYSQFIHKSRYARFLDEERRREHWTETTERYMQFMRLHLEADFGYKLPDNLYTKLHASITNFDVMPSMRAMMTAGKALSRDNTAGYNCAYLPVDDPKAFDEAMHILLCGTGVGYSVERQYVNKLPEIPDQLFQSDTTIVVKDSKEGWAKAFRQVIALLYSGEIPRWDLSRVRPAGSRLKTFGGRCLTGDTIVYKDRKKSRGYNEITIKDLFDMERSRGKWTHKANHFKQVKIRSLNEKTGEFYRNNLIAVHDNGIHEVYQIVTENGYRIKATANHRFLAQDGEYQFVENFELGDLIGVNGSPELKTGTCTDCGCDISRRSTRCKSCFDVYQQKDDCLETTSRQRKVVREYRNDHEFCELCGCHENESKLEVHHINGSPYNNKDENLLCVCPTCHRKEDMQRIYFGDAYSCRYLMFDKIISIEYAGKEQTYDLEMEAPDHNFVANGFVSHNSSGPGPVDDLFKFAVYTFQQAVGRKLHSIEAHDLMCKVGETVVVGGVRRAAMISLSNLSDDRMRHAKSGAWWEANPQRALSNNSACYTEKPDVGIFMEEWLALYNSKSGERGLFNREASIKICEKLERRDPNHEFGTNPCSEIILRPQQFCNLTEVVVRATDNWDDLITKVELATILGTFQSTLTSFPYLRKAWVRNTEEERLLGVSLTGIYDNKLLNNYKSKELSEGLSALRDTAIKINKKWADLLEIPPAAAITCVKPSGTVSQLVNAASGIHSRYAKYYIRRVRNDIKDPLTQHMIEAGVPFEPDVMNPQNVVFSFPQKAPEAAITRKQINAIDHLNLWLVYQRYWCEHKPSVTISVHEDEWPMVGAWVWEHFDEVSGVSFLPFDSGTYRQAPYEEIDKKQYEEILKQIPEIIDWEALVEYEDNGEAAQTLACSAATGCEV